MPRCSICQRFPPRRRIQPAVEVIASGTRSRKPRKPTVIKGRLATSFHMAARSKDVAKRPFITVGFLGFLLLVPLAITSTAGWIRRLGGKRWQMLHRGIYFAAVAGVIHYYWKVKSDVRMPIFYGVLVGILLLWRLGDWFFKRRRQAPSRVTAPSVSVNG